MSWRQAGVARGDRVAIMLEPSLPFYGALFGTVKRGAVAVPLFTLFGPEGLALRIDDCRPRLLLVQRDAERWRARFPAVTVLAIDDLPDRLRAAPTRYTPETAPDDLALFQYTSGTTRALPEAVRHTHRAVVTLMVAALYGIGLAAGDRYFCPSSPAWGHGLWHGTIAPLALGIAVGAYSGKLRRPSHRGRARTPSASPTSPPRPPSTGCCASRARRTAAASRPRKLSYTGEPMDAQDLRLRGGGDVRRAPVQHVRQHRGRRDHRRLPGLRRLRGAAAARSARPRRAGRWRWWAPEGARCRPASSARSRSGGAGEWFRVKDRGHMDADGYFFHAGRSDDVIISAGWTMSALEIEQALLAHPDVREAAVIGVPDELRGQIPKACIVAARQGRRLRRGAPGVREEPAQPARVPARHRDRDRAAQDAGGEDRPENPA